MLECLANRLTSLSFIVDTNGGWTVPVDDETPKLNLSGIVVHRSNRPNFGKSISSTDIYVCRHFRADHSTSKLQAIWIEVRGSPS